MQKLSNKGQYIVSSHKGGTYAKFNRNKRKTKFDEVIKKSMEMPGPGTYQAHSEFGIYDNENYQSFRMKAR